MNLRRLVQEIDSRLTTGELVTLDGTESLEDYEMDLDRAIDLDALDAVMAGFSGRDLDAGDDAAMAKAVRSGLPLTSREASDRHVWWWLTVRKYPDIVQRRWAKDGEPPELSRARMLGPVNRNALARLWWGAQMVQKLDAPERYTGLMFRNQDLFEAIVGRSLSRYPAALKVILDELSGLPGLQARLTVRDLRFILSTLVLEAVQSTELAAEVRRLAEGNA